MTIELDSKPSWLLVIFLGFQHVLAALGGIIAVPVILGTSLELNSYEKSLLVSSALLIAGVATIIQSWGIGSVGARLPCLMGTSFAFLAPALSVGKEFGLGAVFAATALGSLIEIGLSWGIPWIKKVFPSPITGAVIVLIGSTLLPIGVDWVELSSLASTEDHSLRNLLIAIAVVVTILLVRFFAPKKLRLFSVLIGLIIGYLISIPLELVELSAINLKPIIAIPSPMHWSWEFHIGAFITFAVIYVVTTVETVGDIFAIGSACKIQVNNKHLSGGIRGDGMGSLLAGLINATPNTTFSQNIGIIALTGVASRFVVIGSGCILILMGLFPWFGSIFVTIPRPVLGGMMIVLCLTIVSEGLKIILHSAIKKTDFLLAGGTVVTGILFEVLELSEAGLLQPIINSGIVMGVFCGVALNILITKLIK